MKGRAAFFQKDGLQLSALPYLLLGLVHGNQWYLGNKAEIVLHSVGASWRGAWESLTSKIWTEGSPRGLN
jgi:hypothetical protein